MKSYQVVIKFIALSLRSYVVNLFSISDTLGSCLNVDNLVVISAVIDLMVISSVIPACVPGEVRWPGVGFPLSHLVPVGDWRFWGLSLVFKSEDKVIVGAIIDTTGPSL